MRAKKGFTLIELIVAMVLATMLLGALIPLLVTAQKSTYDAQKKTRAAQAGEAIYTYIAGQLRSAERVFLSDGTAVPTDPPAEKWNQITVGADGLLKVNDVTPYPGSYQEGAALTLTAQGHDRTALDLTVQLGELYEKTSAVSLQNLIRTGFSQTEGVVGKALSAQQTDAGGALTIYYLGGDGSVGVFPTPDPDPDSSHTTPAEDKLTVTVLNKTLRVKAGEEGTIQAYIHVPAGKTASFTWVQSPTGYLTFTETATPATGTLTASGTVTMRVYGTKVTEENKPVQVTLQATLTDATETKQDSCAVTVYETEPSEPHDGLMLHYTKNQSISDAYNGDIARQTVIWKRSEVQNGFTLSLAPTKNATNIVMSEWSILEADSDATLQAFQQQLPAQAEHSYRYVGQPPRGWVTIKAKVSEKGNNNAPTDLLGQWTYTTIVFYDEGDYTLAAALAGSPAQDGKTLTINYPEAENVVGMPAAAATLTITPKDAQARESLKKFLPALQGQLITNDWNLWKDDPLFTKPVATSAFTLLPGGSYQCTIPLAYARNMDSRETKETVRFFGRLTDADGTEFLRDNDEMAVTVQKTEILLPEPKLIFRDNQESSLAMDYSKGARIVAELQFTFTGKNAEENANKFAGQQAAIYSDAIGAWPDDPLVKQPLSYSALTVKESEQENEYILYAVFSLQLARHPTKDVETMNFVAAVLTDQSKSAKATLTVHDSDSKMVLRLDKGGGKGMIVSNQTLVVDPAFDGLYLSAYENETSTVPLTGGTWKKENRNGLLIISNRWVSEPTKEVNNSVSYYTDNQNASTVKREPERGKDYVFEWWGKPSCWANYNWAKIVYTAKDGTTAFTTLRVQNTSQSYQTALSPKSQEAVVGTPVTLTLDTTYEKDARYQVVWTVDNTELFLCPEEPKDTTFTTDSNGRDTPTITLQPNPKAYADLSTTVIVTATWETLGGEAALFGQQSVTVHVNPLPLELCQRVGTQWVPVTGTLTKAVNEPVMLAVFQGSQQMAGAWTSDREDLLPGQEDLGAGYSQVARKKGTVSLTFTSETGRPITAQVQIEAPEDVPGYDTPTGDLLTDANDADIMMSLGAEGKVLGYNALRGSENNHTITLYRLDPDKGWSPLIRHQTDNTERETVGNLQVSIVRDKNGMQLEFKQIGTVAEPVVEKFQLIAVKNGGKETRVSSVITVTLLP